MKCGTCWHLAALGGGCGAGAARGPWRGVGVGSCVPGLHEGETPGGAGASHREGRLANEPLSPGGVFPREERPPETEQLMARRGRRGLCFGVQEGTPGPGGHARTHRAACLGPGAGPSEGVAPTEQSGALWSGVSATPCGLCWPSSQDRSGVCSVPCLGDPPPPVFTPAPLLTVPAPSPPDPWTLGADQAQPLTPHRWATLPWQLVQDRGPIRVLPWEVSN